MGVSPHLVSATRKNYLSSSRLRLEASIAWDRTKMQDGCLASSQASANYNLMFCTTDQSEAREGTETLHLVPDNKVSGLRVQTEALHPPQPDV